MVSSPSFRRLGGACGVGKEERRTHRAVKLRSISERNFEFLHIDMCVRVLSVLQTEVSHYLEWS